ncbi:MAG: cob(I)yrinic acid a,c-diamide adenosyltransferase [Candidatus Limnocylindrales bacterium]
MTERRAGIRDSAVATGRGDDGSTGLLFGGERVPKDDPRTEAYGTVDEAVAALGRARADLAMGGRPGAMTPALASIGELILRFQRELFVVGAELAANEDARGRLQDDVSRVSEQMVERVEATLADLEAHVALPTEFVVPGESQVSASLELARTIVRRAERRVVGLRRQGLAGEWTLPYLNRLADLLWVLARAAEVAESRPARPARSGSRGGRARAAAGVPDPAVGPAPNRPESFSA